MASVVVERQGGERCYVSCSQRGEMIWSYLQHSSGLENSRSISCYLERRFQPSRGVRGAEQTCRTTARCRRQEIGLRPGFAEAVRILSLALVLSAITFVLLRALPISWSNDLAIWIAKVPAPC